LLKFGTEFDHVTSDLLQTSMIKGQRARSQRDVITGQKVTQLSITQSGIIRLCSNCVHTLITWHLMYLFKVNGSEVKITALHNVSASKIVTFHEQIGW